ncbi:MAG TPA: c-type cytochrome [Gemmatimonadaceae bacterium]|nr:c-type cytochrome [Gemmatimonadaceae bacterium]
MLTNVLIFVVVIALAVTAILFTWRTRRAAGRARKWIALAAGGIVAVVLTIISVSSTHGLVMLYAPRGRAVRDLKIDRTAERIARGRHFAEISCAGCHTLNGELPLSGGKNLSDEAGMPLGDLYTINLTPAGPLATWTDGEIFRAVRDGADRNGHRLPVMSAQRVRNLSDDDLMSVIAFLRSQEAVKNETPPPAPSFLTVVLAGANMLPLLPGLPPDTIVAPAPGPTREYGEYMVRWMGCDECHGPHYTGGGGGVVPKGPTLRTVKGWTRDGFLTTLRTGRTPFGKQLDSTKMFYKIYGRATDDELTAIYTYLTSLN